ncbi:DUF6328 family protein [Actinomadura sp. 9N215]|uniref:DUF6328 family protein n=1 Tax=Actinomadura sp. 9N215 TaxID=3375150 RepID=UPI0037B46856
MNADQTPVPAGSPRENTGERADRNFVELLHGVRVAVTGVQVLFAFLLTVPFSPGFAEVADSDRGLYYLALTSAAVASVFFIAPVAQHRILFRQGLKEPLVHRASLYSLIGTLALAVSMTSATLMVVGYLFDGPLPLLTAAATAALAAWLWFIQPVLQRSKDS